MRGAGWFFWVFCIFFYCTTFFDCFYFNFVLLFFILFFCLSTYILSQGLLIHWFKLFNTWLRRYSCNTENNFYILLFFRLFSSYSRLDLLHLRSANFFFNFFGDLVIFSCYNHFSSFKIIIIHRFMSVSPKNLKVEKICLRSGNAVIF